MEDPVVLFKLGNMIGSVHKSIYDRDWESASFKAIELAQLLTVIYEREGVS